MIIIVNISTSRFFLVVVIIVVASSSVVSILIGCVLVPSVVVFFVIAFVTAFGVLPNQHQATVCKIINQNDHQNDTPGGTTRFRSDARSVASRDGTG